jgi:hypothetical protein
MKLKFILIIFLGLLTEKIFAQNLSIENGALKFSSLAIYEQYAENILNRNDINTATNSITTLEKQSPPQVITDSILAIEGDTLYPDFFRKILNTDKIFALSTFLIKMDLENHRALIINAKIPNAYSTLVSNNLTANGIMIFDDETDNAMDILEGLENGTLNIKNYKSALTAPQGLFRKCSGAPRNTDKSVELWNQIGRVYYSMRNKVVYEKFIFYFSLQSKEESRLGYNSSTYGYNYAATLKLIGNVKYVKVNNCNREWIDSHTDDGCNIEYPYRQTGWRAYEGSRALRKYDFTVNFYIKHFKNPCLATDFYASRAYRIVSGF